MRSPAVYSMAADWGRFIGFLLVFVGTLVAIVVGSPPASCFSSPGSCGGGTTATIVNGILIAKILWAIGLFFIAGGAGIRLRWSSNRPSGPTSAEDLNWILASRRFNGLLFLISLVLLFILLLSIYVPTVSLSGLRLFG